MSKIDKAIDYDSEDWSNLKYDIAKIQQAYLSISKLSPTAIEANPSTHRIAEYVWGKLQQAKKDREDALRMFTNALMIKNIWLINPSNCSSEHWGEMLALKKMEDGFNKLIKQLSE